MTTRVASHFPTSSMDLRIGLIGAILVGLLRFARSLVELSADLLARLEVHP